MAPKAGPKPRLYRVEDTVHATIQTAAGDQEVALSLVIPWKRMKAMQASAQSDDPVSVFESFLNDIGGQEAIDTFDEALDAAEVMAVATRYFEFFEERTQEKVGELSRSSER